MNYNSSVRVLVAGIGGASLGVEILKSLIHAGKFAVFGCDISNLAYGHYHSGTVETFVVDRSRYVESIIDLCETYNIGVVVPGGEEPLILLSQAKKQFQQLGVHLAANTSDVVSKCSDKRQLFELLKKLKFPIPWTIAVQDVHNFASLKDVPYPCVIKPTTGTGGSNMVFLAANRKEALLYITHLLNSDRIPLIQEYIPLDEGEFTVGILSLPNRQLIGSVAMRRLFHVRLSTLVKTETGIISSGYSQGLIDEFPEVRTQAEKITKAIGSAGPLNIQGRVRQGVFIPFEINPRFSASTYLRTLAGFNEIDMFLHHICFGEQPAAPQIRPGYYLRNLTETYVSYEAIK